MPIYVSLTNAKSKKKNILYPQACSDFPEIQLDNTPIVLSLAIHKLDPRQGNLAG